MDSPVEFRFVNAESLCSKSYMLLASGAGTLARLTRALATFPSAVAFGALYGLSAYDLHVVEL